MAKKKNRFGLQFEGFEEMAEKFEKLGGDLKPLAEKALIESHNLVTPNIHAAMRKHKKTGRTENSIVETAHITWSGTVASDEIGFNLKNGGMPSIYLMYGTPKMKPDKKLYNAIYGSKTKKELSELQKKIFADAIKERMEG